MTTQDENENVPLLQCPWCKCMFCCQDDLNSHLNADVFVNKPAPVNCDALNERDHQNNFKHIHFMLENHWLDNE
jgi:hypothetical protein